MRLFLALVPPEPVRDALIGAMEGVAGARWQADEQLHLTVRFIGDADRRAAADLDAQLARLRHPAFAVRLEGAGVFEHRGRPEALWIGAGPLAPLAALHRKADQAAAQAGLPRETRAYRPHVTLARLPRGAGPPGEAMARIGRLGALLFDARELVLFGSRLGQSGAHYEPVARYALHGMEQAATTES
jgi:2'-5' RNA ligase